MLYVQLEREAQQALYFDDGFITGTDGIRINKHLRSQNRSATQRHGSHAKLFGCVTISSSVTPLAEGLSLKANTSKLDAYDRILKCIQHVGSQ